jgi:predicted nuclease of predicted toxin-antitoxin system
VTLWLDNQLPPALTAWVGANLGVDCTSVRALALQRAADLEIFQAARAAGALVMTKDADFAALVNQLGSPQIVLVPCGNTSNAHLREVLATAWPTVREMLERGEPLVEIGDRPRQR